VATVVHWHQGQPVPVPEVRQRMVADQLIADGDTDWLDLTPVFRRHGGGKTGRGPLVNPRELNQDRLPPLRRRSAVGPRHRLPHLRD